MTTEVTKRQVVRNTVTGWVAAGCRVGIALAIVPFLLDSLGKDGYGLIGLLGVIVSLSVVADLGLRQALGRGLSEKVVNQDVEGFRALSSTAMALYLGIATVLIVIQWVLAPWLASVFNVPDRLRDSAIWMIRLYGGASLLLSFIKPVFAAGLQSFLRFDSVNVVQTISVIGSGVLLFICISYVSISPLVVWAVVMFSVLLLDLLLLWILYRRRCFSGKLGLRYLDSRTLKPLLHLGSSMYVLQLTGAIAERSDPLVVSFFLGTAGVALYQTGAKLSQVLRPVVMMLSTQVYPLTTRFHVLDQQDRQKRALVLGTRYTLLFGVVVSAGLVLFAERFCWLWLYGVLGSDYVTVVHVMRLWALASIAEYAGAMHWPLLLGMKRMKFAIAIQVPSAMFNILVSIYLVGFTDLGIPGVLVATILTNLVRRPISIWYVSKVTGLSIAEHLRSAYLPGGILLLLLAAFHYVLRICPIYSWSMLIVFAALFGAYAALILMVLERQLITGMWRQWRGK